MFVLSKEEAARFLHAYGWLGGVTLDAAIKAYQRFHGILETGEVDPATTRSLLEPRFCAAPDRLEGSPTLEAKWPRPEIAYWITGALPGLSMAETWEAFEEGCVSWNRVANLKLHKASSRSSAMIVADVGPIDGSGGTLAWSTLGRGSPCTQKYDSRDHWGSGGLYAPAVICHEVGHALDLGHSSKSGQLMSPTYSKNIKVPQEEDIRRIQAIYGKPLGGPPGGGTGKQIQVTLMDGGVRYEASGEMRKVA